MLIAWLPVAVALVGLLLWALAPGKAGEAGKVLFAIGCFWAVGRVSGETVRLLR